MQSGDPTTPKVSGAWEGHREAQWKDRVRMTQSLERGPEQRERRKQTRHKGQSELRQRDTQGAQKDTTKRQTRAYRAGDCFQRLLGNPDTQSSQRPEARAWATRTHRPCRSQRLRATAPPDPAAGAGGRAEPRCSPGPRPAAAARPAPPARSRGARLRSPLNPWWPGLHAAPLPAPLTVIPEGGGARLSTHPPPSSGN